MQALTLVCQELQVEITKVLTMKQVVPSMLFWRVCTCVQGSAVLFRLFILNTTRSLSLFPFLLFLHFSILICLFLILFFRACRAGSSNGSSGAAVGANTSANDTKLLAFFFCLSLFACC